VGLLLAIAVIAALGLVGSRAAADPRLTARGLRLTSALLPPSVFLVGVVMIALLAGCELADTCSGDSCEKCEIQSDASEPIFFGYLASVASIWLASVIDGFRGERTRQKRRLKLAVRAAVVAPILLFIAFVLFRAL
jgi:hypothetical protein